MIALENIDNQQVWDGLVEELCGHPLQLWGWGEVKAAHNWRVERVRVTDGERVIGIAQILYRPLPGGLRFAYVPRGPVVTGGNEQIVLDAIAPHTKRQRAIMLTVEPHWREYSPRNGWKQSMQTILIPRTLIIDLNKSLDELMVSISRKRRYDIRRGTQQAHSIKRVKTEQELKQCLDIYRATATRARFSLHGDEYYKDIFHQLGENCFVSAVFDDQGNVMSFSWTAISGSIGFELYGGSSEAGNKLMANYALKWWVIQQLKLLGIKQYDLNGLMNDGISHFKRSFSDHEDQLVGTYEKSLSPLSIVWKKGLPLAKKAVRAVKS